MRDMLGLVRAIYLAEKADKAPAHRLNRISTVGRDLKEVIRMGRRQRERSAISRRGRQRRERRTPVCDLVDVLTMAEPLVRASVNRIVLQPQRRRFGR
jgi:hypothetical protein